MFFRVARQSSVQTASKTNTLAGVHPGVVAGASPQHLRINAGWGPPRRRPPASSTINAGWGPPRRPPPAICGHSQFFRSRSRSEEKSTIRERAMQRGNSTWSLAEPEPSQGSNDDEETMGASQIAEPKQNCDDEETNKKRSNPEGRALPAATRSGRSARPKRA